MRSGLLALALAATAVALAWTATAAAAAPLDLTVRNERARVSTSLGERFSFTTTITNESSSATEALVAHLNVVGLEPDVYVDPEDWSSDRTVFVGSIAPSASRTVTWKVQAVTHGSLAAYVAVLPQRRPAAAPVTGPALQLEIAERTTVAAGGMLAVAIVVPAVLGLALIATRIRRRRALA